MTQKEMIEDIWHKVSAKQGVSSRTVLIRRLLEVATVTAILAGVGVAVFLLMAGKLTAGDIARILEAWKG